MSYSSGLNQRRSESEQIFAAFEREWRATWTSELTLPLLKDLFHNDANVAVKRSRVAREISNEDFRRQLTDLILEVDEAYWELAAARAEERVTQKSQQTAEDLLEQTRVQYEVGVVSKVNVTQAEAGVAEREVDAIVAKNRAARAQDNLLNIVLAPGASDFEGTELLPKDPAFIEFEADLEAALEKAMRSRPELEAARQRVQDAKIQLAFAENQRLPSLDLSGVFQIDGLSGHPKDPNITALELGGSGDAYDDFFTHDGANTWEVKANMSIPLGNRTARAQITQRKIELRRARTSLRNEEQRIVLEVRNAVRDLRSALEALEATERRRIAQEETLRAEQEKLRLGDSTPHDVLEFEEDLAEAERQEINAFQLYRNAITALERGQATLLPTHGISVETELRR
jgi:outer membrane protein TolC